MSTDASFTAAGQHRQVCAFFVCSMGLCLFGLLTFPAGMISHSFSMPAFYVAPGVFHSKLHGTRYNIRYSLYSLGIYVKHSDVSI